MKLSRKKEPSILARDSLITLAFLAGATMISGITSYAGGSTTNTALSYILAVVLIARYTHGYIPGIIASLVGVVCVNYVFTYPYMDLNFTLDGYPVTFLAMLVISGITSTTTTHQKEQSRLIKERELLLVKAEKETMRANLLRAVSHDLRTPLTSIIGASSAYLENRESMSEEEKNTMVENIREDAGWLLNMVENLLSVTRIREEDTHVTKTPEPLEEVASEAVQRFHKRIPDQKVSVSVPEDFLMVPMDATLIEQVIINLLENAVYHSHSEEPIDLVITVSDGFAFFHVIDHGDGISPERLNTLFDGDPVREGSSGDSHKGMGIGLSICKTIVAAHGGTITATNEERGARFTFTLPLGDETYE